MKNMHLNENTVENLRHSGEELHFAVTYQVDQLQKWSRRFDVATYLSRDDKVLAKVEFDDLASNLHDLLQKVELFKREVVEVDFVQDDDLKIRNLIISRKELYSRLRAALSLYASLVTNFNWQSPAIKSSFGTRVGIEKSEVVADWNDYKRDRSEDVFYCEQYLLQHLFNATPNTNSLNTLNVCNSGMGSFTTVLYYLLSENILKKSALVSNYNYVENKLLLKSFLKEKVSFFDETDSEDIVALIHSQRPSVVFLEQISNTRELRIFDVYNIIKKIILSYKEDIYFVIDITCSLGFESQLTSLELPSNIKLLLHGSLLKAPQLGLERVNMGFVYSLNLGEDSKKILDNRTLSGTNVQDFAANLLPFTNRQLLQKRMEIISSNARFLAEAVAAFDPSHDVIDRVVYPGLPSHHDFDVAERIGFFGFFFNIKFVEKFNSDKFFEIFTNKLINVARIAESEIIHGASFGFNHTSVYYSVGWDEPENHYVRISTGIETEYEMKIMSEVLLRALEEFKEQVMND